MAVEPLSKLPRGAQNYYAILGRIVIEWNHAESQLRGMLSRMAGPEGTTAAMRAQILTSELGAVGLEHALRTHIAHLTDRKFAKSATHAVDFYARLRPYRNYYVHGILTLIAFKDTGYVGFIHYLEAKGKFVERREMVLAKTLETLFGHATKFRVFAQGLVAYQVAQRIAALGGPTDIGKLPRRPPLPPQLQKPARHLVAPPRRRKSSRA